MKVDRASELAWGLTGGVPGFKRVSLCSWVSLSPLMSRVILIPECSFEVRMEIRGARIADFGHDGSRSRAACRAENDLPDAGL